MARGLGEFEQVLEAWDGEQVLVRRDTTTGTWMLICIHSRRLGPAGGGTRMMVYESPAAALRDGTRLAAGMTVKLAVAGAPFGGGKAVLAVPALPEGEERRTLMRRYGDMIASLGGSYYTGCDMNVTAADLEIVAERTPCVFGRSEAAGGSGEPGSYTARGVLHGIRASLLTAFGSDELAGRSVLVQGVGSVGTPLAEQLAEAGARVVVSDVAEDRAATIAARIGAAVVSPAGAIGTEVDVYAPCATGATLSAETIPALRCRVVAGSANNQLATSEDADRLRERGILYAPDFVINAGGVLYNLGVETRGWNAEQIEEGLAGIGRTLLDVFARAEAGGVSPGAAALALADERLAAA